MSVPYHVALKRIESAIKEERMKRKALIAHQAVIEELDKHFSGYTYIYSDRTIEYFIYLYSQPGFTSEANPKLIENLEIIEEILSPLGEVNLESTDNAAESERIFTFSAGKVKVTVVTKLSSDTALCERQISGYEEVEERREVTIKVAKPIYKFVC
jgi:hypothetical protein